MIATERRYGGAPRAVAGPASWMTTKPWVYTAIVFGCWALVPEVRRLIDWKSSFSSVSVISIVPLLSLVPAVLALVYGRRLSRVDGRLKAIAWVWFGGFGYALVVGLASQNYAAAAYTFANFCLATCLGLWLASVDVAPLDLYARFASFTLDLATPIALYGAVQYALLPEWDATWMRQANIISIGHPFAFQLRPFSTLNAPGTFALFLVAVLTMNLPRLRGGHVLRLAQMGICAVMLLLTQVRSGWLGMLVALVVYVALTPNKARNLFMIGAFTVVLVVFASNASALFGSSAAGDLLQRRLDTTSNLSGDTSVQNREQYFGDILVSALRTPTGSGLGTIGTAAKLGGGGETVDFDNGAIARLVEMGWFGTACYYAAILGALSLTYSRWRAQARSGSPMLASVYAAAIAFEATLAVLDFSGDQHNALSGVFFWTVLGLAVVRSRESAPLVGAAR